MSRELPRAGIDCVVIPRKQAMEQPISASTARLLLKKGDFDTLARFVPPSTLDYFKSQEAAPVIAKIRQAENEVHY